MINDLDRLHKYVIYKHTFLTNSVLKKCGRNLLIEKRLMGSVLIPLFSLFKYLEGVAMLV